MAGTRLAKTPRKIAKTKDITGGLAAGGRAVRGPPSERRRRDREDRWHRRFRRRRVRGKRRLIVTDPQTGAEEEHLIPLGKHIIVFKGDFVKKGQQLTEGPVVPHEVLDVCGPQELQEHLLNEVQEVYRLQGVKSMTSISKSSCARCCARLRSPIPATPVSCGETRSTGSNSKQKTSASSKRAASPPTPARLAGHHQGLPGDRQLHLSAASFQDTTRVLTEAATLGKVDHLRGFKENVIMGHLIPAGTGFKRNREIEIAHIGDSLQIEPNRTKLQADHVLRQISKL